MNKRITNSGLGGTGSDCGRIWGVLTRSWRGSNAAGLFFGSIRRFSSISPFIFDRAELFEIWKLFRITHFLRCLNFPSHFENYKIKILENIIKRLTKLLVDCTSVLSSCSWEDRFFFLTFLTLTGGGGAESQMMSSSSSSASSRTCKKRFSNFLPTFQIC